MSLLQSGASRCPQLRERSLDGSLIPWLCVECKAASWSMVMASTGQSEEVSHGIATSVRPSNIDPACCIS